MLNARVLIVDGVEVPVQASHRLRQSYETLEAKERRRFLGGGLWQRRTWSGPLLTRIEGDGIAPPGIQNLDTANPIQIACIESRGVNSVSNVIVLPSDRRSDVGSQPFGFAVVDEAFVPTPVALVGDTATLTPVIGAVQYQARYFPLLTVLADPLQEDFARGTGHHWMLTAEEVGP